MGFLEWKALEGRHKPKELSNICRDKLKELQTRENFQEKGKKTIQSGILSRKAQVIWVINSTYEKIMGGEMEWEQQEEKEESPKREPGAVGKNP